MSKDEVLERVLRWLCTRRDNLRPTALFRELMRARRRRLSMAELQKLAVERWKRFRQARRGDGLGVADLLWKPHIAVYTTAHVRRALRRTARSLRNQIENEWNKTDGVRLGWLVTLDWPHGTSKLSLNAYSRSLTADPHWSEALECVEDLEAVLDRERPTNLDSSQIEAALERLRRLCQQLSEWIRKEP